MNFIQNRKDMRTTIYILTLLMLSACNRGKTNTTIEPIENEVAEKEHNGEIHLNPSQLKLADIAIEPIRKRNVRERINVTGTIEVPPQSKATVYAPLEAFVQKSELLPGDKIDKGETVAVLQHPNFSQLQYAYLEAINNREVLKADYDRKKMLLENEIASLKSFQTAESAYRSAESLVASYVSQLKMAGLSPQNVQKNGIQQYIYIKSPITGYVVKNNLNKGKFLAANEEMLEIIDTEHMHAELKVFGTDIAKVEQGTDFLFKPSGIDAEYVGYIKLISQAVNEGDKTVNVHGHFEDKKGLLKAGTFINAQIMTTSNNVYAVPESAIVEREGESFVFVAESSNEFMPLEVTVGNADEGYVELVSIADGIFERKIVAKGSHFLKGKWMELSGEMEGHAH